MNNINGAILFRCGDSRNGGLYKALKKHYGWLPYCRIKTIGLAGGAHSPRSLQVARKIVLEEVEIYTAALVNMGATAITFIVTEHEDCGCVALKGRQDIETRWMNKNFTQKLFAISPAIENVSLMHVGYQSREKAVVPSHEVVLTLLSSSPRAQ